ncbi:MAG: hypothetical protein IJ916_06500 [Paludibacteraceae bacterium]|nr:hypothetical protein [Paludibacteraceae bacterium]
MRNYFIRFCNKIVRHTDWYNNIYWGGVSKFWRQNTFGLEVVNLGSGAGVNAFVYDQNVKGANWALSPQSLLHDYDILKNYFSYIREGGYVLIIICPFSCLVSQYDKKHNFKYYTFLHPATIQNFDDKERTRALMIKANPFGQMPVYCVKQTIKDVFRKIKKMLFSPKKDLQKSADAMMSGWLKQFEISDLSAPLSEKHLTEQESRKKTLIEMVDFCKERALKPVIVIPPMHHTLCAMFPPEFKTNYIDAFLSGIDVPVLNYMNDVLMDKEEYYQSALFLNEQGARVFTKRVLKDIGIYVCH